LEAALPWVISDRGPPQKETPHPTQIHSAEAVPDAGSKILNAPLDQPHALVGAAIAAKDGPENRIHVFGFPHR